jgi:hypothetical protein
MSLSLYIFNPEHDLALANADGNFMAPLSARKLAKDLAALPLWYSDENSYIYASTKNKLWLNELQILFSKLESKEIVAQPDFEKIKSLNVWGWDKAVIMQFSNFGAPENLQPPSNKIEHIKRLSHRRMAIEAMEFVINNASMALSNIFPEKAIEIFALKDAEEFALVKKPVVFKAPWSGSGKGLSWVRGKLSESHRGWIKNTIEKQGSVIAEQIYNVVENFALEFECKNGEVFFAGYSLFESEGGIYRGNILMSDAKIVEHLTKHFISKENLMEVQNHLREFIQLKIAPCYSGVLGIDMFIFEENKFLKLHPCVEINLRMTMGFVAHEFFDKFVDIDAKGKFYIDHNPFAGALWVDHTERTKKFPLKVENGRIKGGYLSLTEVQEHSHYRVRVEVTPNHPSYLMR